MNEKIMKIVYFLKNNHKKIDNTIIQKAMRENNFESLEELAKYLIVIAHKYLMNKNFTTFMTMYDQTKFENNLYFMLKIMMDSKEIEIDGFISQFENLKKEFEKQKTNATEFEINIKLLIDKIESKKSGNFLYETFDKGLVDYEILKNYYRNMGIVDERIIFCDIWTYIIEGPNIITRLTCFTTILEQALRHNGPSFKKILRMYAMEIRKIVDRLKTNLEYDQKEVSYIEIEIIRIVSGFTDICAERLADKSKEEVEKELLIGNSPSKNQTFYLPKRNVPRENVLTYLYTMAIDEETTNVMDTAFSIRENSDGTTDFYYHITDVYRILKTAPIINGLAYNMGNKIYRVDNTAVRHMLPQPLVNELSLKKDELRAAITLKFTFDEDLNVINRNAFNSLIVVNDTVTYEQAASVLEQDKEGRTLIGHGLRKASNLADGIKEKMGLSYIPYPIVPIFATFVHAEIAKQAKEMNIPFLYFYFEANDLIPGEFKYLGPYPDVPLDGLTSRISTPLRRYESIYGQELMTTFMINEDFRSETIEKYEEKTETVAKHLQKKYVNNGIYRSYLNLKKL